MARNLTEIELAVLANVVVDPIEWWENCSTNHPDPEVAIAAKVSRYEQAYLTAKDQDGYQTRAQREAQASSNV